MPWPLRRKTKVAGSNAAPRLDIGVVPVATVEGLGDAPGLGRDAASVAAGAGWTWRKCVAKLPRLDRTQATFVTQMRAKGRRLTRSARRGATTQAVGQARGAILGAHAGEAQVQGPRQPRDVEEHGRAEAREGAVGATRQQEHLVLRASPRAQEDLVGGEGLRQRSPTSRSSAHRAASFSSESLRRGGSTHSYPVRGLGRIGRCQVRGDPASVAARRSSACLGVERRGRCARARTPSGGRSSHEVRCEGRVAGLDPGVLGPLDLERHGDDGHPQRARRGGRRRAASLPMPGGPRVVPSGKTTVVTPPAVSLRRARRATAPLRASSRRTKMVPARCEAQPRTGERSTSLLATKDKGVSEARTAMSA